MQCIFILFVLLTSAFAAPGKIVIVGGNNGTVNFADVIALNAQTGQWTTMPSLPYAAEGVGLTTLKNVIYAIAGNVNAPKIAEAFSLDPNVGKWTTEAPLKKQKANGISAFSIGDIVYAVGGSPDWYGLEMVKPNASVWMAGASSKNYHYYSNGAVFNGTYYICGDYLQPSSSCEMYDPVSNVWTVTQPMQTPRFLLSLVALDNYIYAIGGAQGKNERFDPAKKEWTYISANLHVRQLHATASDGQYIYAIGGCDTLGDCNAVIDTIEFYILATDTWHWSSPLPSARAYAAAVYLPNALDGPTAEDDLQKSRIY